MEMRRHRKHLEEIYAREAMCEEVFDTCVSEQGAEGVLNTLGELLFWLDGIASCRWGCKGGDHEAEHLLGRASASASASLLLLRRGYIDQASGIFRELAETMNLLDLFTHSDEDYEEWRRSDESVRKNQYSAYKVRLKLEKLKVDPVMGRDAYQLLSKYGTHPGPGAEPRPHDSPEEPTAGTAYRPAVSLSFVVAVGNAVVGALIFGSNLVPQASVKLDVLNAAVAAGEELRGIDLDALKKESTLVLFPPRIDVTVETQEDGAASAPDAVTTTSSREPDD